MEIRAQTYTKNFAVYGPPTHPYSMEKQDAIFICLAATTLTRKYREISQNEDILYSISLSHIRTQVHTFSADFY